MRFFYDCEFVEDGETIDLLSIGIVTSTMDRLYRINADADWRAASDHPWVSENVLPHLPGDWTTDEQGRSIWLPDTTDARVYPYHMIAEHVERFIGGFGLDRRKHELWAYYGAYDHVVLAQLWGRMIDLPGCIPMYTNDIKQLIGELKPPEQIADEHDALADALWNRYVFNWWAGKQRTARKEALAARYAAESDLQERVAELEGIPAVWKALTPAQRAEVRNATRGTTFWRLLDREAVVDTGQQ